MDSYQATQAVISFETGGGLSPGGEALYWLQNLSDTPVEFWSEQPGHGYRSLAITNDPAELGEPLHAHCAGFGQEPAKSRLVLAIIACDHVSVKCRAIASIHMACLLWHWLHLHGSWMDVCAQSSVLHLNACASVTQHSPRMSATG